MTRRDKLMLIPGPGVNDPGIHTHKLELRQFEYPEATALVKVFH